MEFSQIKKDLEAMDVGAMIEDEPMYKHTTYKVGGPARIYLKVKDTESLIKTIEYCNENQVQYKVIGRGSNLLFSDKEYEGVIFMINSVDNYCYLTVDELGYFYYLLRSINMTDLSLQVMNYYQLLKNDTDRNVRDLTKEYSKPPIIEEVEDIPEPNRIPPIIEPNEIPDLY